MTQAEYFKFHHNPKHPILSQKFQNEVNELTHSQLRVPNVFQILVNPKPSLTKRIEIIKEAREIILLSSFLIAGFGDDLIDEFVNALIQKAKEGLPVYFIIDSYQSMWGMNFLSRLERGGVKIAYYNTTLVEDGIPGNIRDHEKYVIIDFKKAILGGQNIMNKIHPRAFVDSFYWRDTDVYVEGEIAKDMSFRFLMLWERLSQKDKSLAKVFEDKDEFLVIDELKSYMENLPPHTGSARFLYNEGYTGDKNISQYYLKVINAAQDVIVWQGNFVDLPDVFVEALIRAAERGVRVIIMTNSSSSAWWATHPYYLYKVMNGYMDFENSKVEIRVYQEQFNHSKIFYVDGVLASVGSCNHDFMSLEADTEGTLVIYNKETIKQVYDLLQVDLEDTKTFDPAPYEKYRIYKKYVPLLPYPLENKFNQSRHPFAKPKDPLYIGAGLKQSLELTQDVFLKGRKLNEDVYLIIGMKNTVSDTATLLGRAGHHFSRMIIQTPENLMNVFDSQLTMGQEILSDIGETTYEAYKFMQESISNMGETLEVQGSSGVPYAVAQGFIGIAGSTAYLGLKLPARIAVDVIHNAGRTSFALLRQPVRGGVKLILAPLVAAYGTANTLIGTTIPLVSTLYAGAIEIGYELLGHISTNNSEFLDDLMNPGLKFRD